MAGWNTNVGGVVYRGAANAQPTRHVIKRALANVAAGATDSVVVAAVAGKKIVVIFVVAVAGGTATDLTFNTKPAGAGTAISPLFANGINGGEVLARNDHGWFETTSGEGLTVTTGAGATTGLLVGYVEE